jgi:hypothetical protein
MKVENEKEFKKYKFCPQEMFKQLMRKLKKLNATLIKNVRLEINILNRCRPEGA